MCYYSKQTTDATKLMNRFLAKMKDESLLFQSEYFNGFEHPKTPIITNAESELIQLFQWGLIPSWAKDGFDSAKTLNARIGELSEKPSYSGVMHQKCLILLDGFYEWQSFNSKGELDPNGKVKKKHLITREDNEPFAVAGLWSNWKNLKGETIQTYTMLTTEARGIMVEIHNSKRRMPVILKPEIENDWLLGKTTAKLFTDLVAIPV